MKKTKHSFKHRVGYWFDNKMSQGFWPKVGLLLIATFIFVVLIGFLAAIAHGGVRENFLSDFIKSFMYSLGKGGALTADDANVSIVYFALMLLTILYCMFFTAILIGLISNAIRTKIEDLGKGRSRVLEEGHTLILGFNDATFVLLKELLEANRSQTKEQSVVILGETAKNEMIEQIEKRIGWQRANSKTRIICRTGSTCNFADLRRCSIETSRAVIINESNDFDAVKASMACSFILSNNNEQDPFIVSVINNEENLIESKVAISEGDDDRLVVLALNEVLARIMVHTSRQPGLSDVFTELLNFVDDELYIFDEDDSLPKLYGKTISEISSLLIDAFAVGIKRGEEIIIGPPKAVVLNEGDSLIVVKKDDDPLSIRESKPKDIKSQLLTTTKEDSIKVIVIGVQPVLNAVLTEYANYISSGSEICVVDREGAFSSVVEEKTKQLLEKQGIDLQVRSIDASKKRDLDLLLDEFPPASVLVLVDEDSSDPSYEDEVAMRTLIYLRDYRHKSNNYFSITCEMLQSRNKELAVATGSDDFIISRHISALLMSQISQKKEMALLFEELLSSRGYEIYMKPAKWYFPTGKPLDLISAGEELAKRGEILIGLRKRNSDNCEVADINPPKYEDDRFTLKEYTFAKDDYVVVLSNDSHYSEKLTPIV